MNINFIAFPVSEDNRDTLVDNRDTLVDNRDTLVSMMTTMYNYEACGVCEKEGAEVFWFSPFSRCAHAKCVKMITKAAKSNLYIFLDNYFKEESQCGEKNDAHIKAIEAVRIACGSDTILSYLEKNGLDALTNLFKTVGIEAAVRYALLKKTH